MYLKLAITALVVLLLRWTTSEYFFYEIYLCVVAYFTYIFNPLLLLLLLQAKEGKLAVEDMDGGTFTISNGGVYGSMFGTPIINPPQSAILGMHGVFDRPVAIDGKVMRNIPIKIAHI